MSDINYQPPEDKFSGGCPRELLRLLKYAFLEVNSNQFDVHAVERAIVRLSVDYKRILDSNDYPLLAQLDCSEKKDSSSERMRFFLYNMIVLEYNNFWRESHLAIRRLPAYQRHCVNPANPGSDCLNRNFPN